MPDRLFGIKVLRAAEDFFLSLDEADRAEVRRIIGILRIDPYIDGVYKLPFPAQVVVLTVYDNGSWVVLYRFLDNETIQIWAIQRGDPAWRARRGY